MTSNINSYFLKIHINDIGIPLRETYYSSMDDTKVVFVSHGHTKNHVIQIINNLQILRN